MRWRWDQGRLEYFKYENIRAIATVLSELDGVVLGSSADLLRRPLESATGLPFSPSHYKVWRNYARTFQCSLLAFNCNKRLAVTDICRKLADSKSPLSPDEYINLVFSRFSLPFPAFDDYDPNIQQTFPFIAIIKYALTHTESSISLNDVFSFVIGNECTGLEPLDHYSKLSKTSRKPDGDELRQVREMLAFMSQVSYLKWFDSRLYIDANDFRPVEKSIVPSVRIKRSPIPEEEFFAASSLSKSFKPSTLDTLLRERGVGVFAVEEGARVFVVHRKIERSPLVRRRYFLQHPEIVCDACEINTRVRYPWTGNILELHHLLPLSSTLNINGTTTVLDDLVPLCPSCHKSIHLYYKLKLDEWDIPDFGSKKMARDIYNLAKTEIVK